MPTWILSLLGNHYFRDAVGIALLLLACWWGWHYVQELRSDNATLTQTVADLNGKINNLGDVQKAQKESLAAQADAQHRYEVILGTMGRDFASYKLRHSVTIPELVQTDPAKAQTQIADEYHYRLECIEFISGKAFPVEELKKIAPYCGEIK